MIIDIHVHTTNNTLYDLHVKIASVADLESSAEHYGIKKMIVMATYFPFKKSGLYNKELLKRIEGRKLFSAFGSLDAMNRLEEGIPELKELAEAKMISGIKLYPGYQDFSVSDMKVFPLYELAAKHDLPVAIHSGELHNCCPKDGRRMRCLDKCRLEGLGYLSHPKNMAGAIKNFPEVTFVLCHLANPYFEELKEVMAEYPNVCTDISGQYSTGGQWDTEEYREVLKQEMIEFLKLPNGIERILFASDFPIQSFADSIALVKALGLSKEDEDRIFYKNAMEKLKIKVS